nr:hypothetical protein [Tanacetum cinerariifolium]
MPLPLKQRKRAIEKNNGSLRRKKGTCKCFIWFQRAPSARANHISYSMTKMYQLGHYTQKARVRWGTTLKKHGSGVSLER